MKYICIKIHFRKSSAITTWHSSNIKTASTFAHEVGHLLGILHDFENGHPYNDRTELCGPGKWNVGPENQIMNYGTPRQNTWSECSNYDLKVVL